MSIVEAYAQGTPCFVELTTPDLAAARSFYGELFGWAWSDDDATVSGSLVAAVSAGEWPAWVTHLAVADVDAVAARVAELGGTLLAAPADAPGGRVATVEDPSGAVARLWQASAQIGSVRVNEPGCPIWHELTSHDLPAAQAFWSELLGVTWESSPMEGGDPYTCLVVEGRPVGGAFPPPVAEIPPHWEVYVAVADADETAASATRLGGRVVQPPFDVPTVGRLAILQDPQGAVFALMQP